jgi:phospholipid/cholesterol/gamma-HCH transport system substrate-binding protein
VKRIAAILLVAVGVVVALGVQGSEGSGYRVLAIFDTAAFVVPGEDVKIAGVRVGSINSLSVTPDNKAAVEFSITEPGYDDFRKDAECAIRPQSLIGEQFIECALTQPRGAGEAEEPELPADEDGVHLLPVSQTRTSVGLDLIGNINRLPVRQRLSLILNELGVGLAGRGEDLNEVIRRAAPALQETDEVLDLVAEQNKVLAQLAVDSDTILAPLAQQRQSIVSFLRESSTVAEATVERSAALAQNFEKFPTFLREIRPTMDQLINFSDQTIPVARDLLGGAQDINELIELTGPFSQAATPALTSLGQVGIPGIPALRASLPIVKDLGEFGKQLQPVAKDLADVLVSLRKNDSLERFLDYVYFQVQAINGFDNFGHFLRAGLIVNTCSTYAIAPAAECLSKFAQPVSARSAGITPTGDEMLDATARVLAGEDPDAILSEEEQAKVRAQTERNLGAIAAPPEDAADESDSGEATPITPEQSSDLMDFLLGGDEK